MNGLKGGALMHLDGCHFYVWVHLDPDGQTILSYGERRGDDLRLHGMFGREGDRSCQRCHELCDGKARAMHTSKHIDVLPKDAAGSLVAVLDAISEYPGIADEVAS